MKIHIQLIKSPIGRKPKHRATVQALGLRKINQKVVRTLNPQIQGMVDSVSFLLKTEVLK